MRIGTTTVVCSIFHSILAGLRSVGRFKNLTEDPSQSSAVKGLPKCRPSQLGS